MEKSQKASELFSQGYSCSQAVLAVYAEKYGMDEKVLFKISSSFGGGLAGKRDVCGAVTGALMVLGLEYGRTEAKDAQGKAKNYKHVNDYMSQFSEKYLTTNCGKLLEQIKESNKEGNVKLSCNELVSETVKIIDKIMMENKTE